MRKILYLTFIIIFITSCENKPSQSELIKEQITKIVNSLSENSTDGLFKELPNKEDFEKIYLSTKSGNMTLNQFINNFGWYLKKNKVEVFKKLKKRFKGNESEWESIKPYALKGRKMTENMYGDGRIYFITKDNNIYNLSFGFIIVKDKIKVIGIGDNINFTEKEKIDNFLKDKEKLKKANQKTEEFITFFYTW